MEKAENKYSFHCMPMHLHACYEPVRAATWPGASMESHMYMARKLGMKYIRFTDHDTRMGQKRYPADGFDFTLGLKRYIDSSGGYRAWEIEGEPGMRFDGETMTLTSSVDGDEWEESGAYLATSGKRHTVSLLADVTLELELDFTLTGDAQIVLDAQLSQRPPELTPAHLCYAAGEYTADDPHCAVLPLIKDADGLYRLKLTEDSEVPGIGGQDNCFDTLRLILRTRRGGRVELRIKSINISYKYNFDEVLTRQRALAEKLSPNYGVKAFVTSEITGAGNHKICFSSCVPAIDYKARGYNVTTMDAAEHVKSHGGIFAWNHPFELYKGGSLTDEERAELLPRLAASFISSRLWGASLMEVGFPDGRSGFTMAEHLRLWDLLSLAGLFITGYGDSDSHSSGDDGWLCGNNFATWTAADKDTSFPVPEEMFNASLAAGRAYLGDPVHLKGNVSFFCGSVPMGGIIKVSKDDKKARVMSLSLTDVPEGSTVRIIVDGAKAQEIETTEKDFSIDFEVASKLPVSFARCELYLKNGRCIMCTNPIYLVKTDEFAGDIPENRIYAEE